MPRQDVPYGGAICRLRERIAEIFDKLNEKLHTINGVEGDGQGNVLIRSDSAALTITDDQVQHEIVLDLDTSQLPAASVSSVNGQTGTVALTADDIPSDNGDVQTDIDNLEAADTTLQGNINAETLARQNADSTLQTNINTVTASLPAAAAAAVAADPTVAYINSELNNKVDLSDVSTVETPDTIAKRNGSGRLVAADPASGATDKTLTTANWISQTGSGRPNNLIHDSGAETIYGVKTCGDCTRTIIFNSPVDDNVTGTAGYFKKIAVIPRVNFGTRSHTLFAFTTRQRARGFDLLALYTNTNNALDLNLVLRSNSENYTYILSQDSDNIYISIICNGTPADGIQGIILGQTGSASSIINCMLLGGEINATLAGTEIRRITP